MTMPLTRAELESFQRTLVRIVRANTGSAQEAASIIRVLRIIARHEAHSRELAEAFRIAAGVAGRMVTPPLRDHHRTLSDVAEVEALCHDLHEVVDAGHQVTLSWKIASV